MNIDEIIGDKETVILKAMAHPALAPKRNPTIEQAMKAVASEVEVTALKAVQAQVEPLLNDLYDMYTLENGDYDTCEAEQHEDYSSGLDDQVEAALEPWEPYLSQDWLGRNTIDTRLWEEHAIGKLAQSCGKEVFKQLSYNKTPNQVLSNAGIVQTDVELYLEQHIANPEKAKETVMSELTAEDVAAKIKAHVGADFDQMTVYEDLELACDDDEILASGAGKRLGLEDEDLTVLQFVALEHGEDAPQHVLDLVTAAPAKQPKKPAKPKKDKAPEKVEGAIDPRILELLNTHSAVKGTEMATGLGVSRATYNNWMNGKTSFAPDPEQHDTLRNQIVGDVNGLLEALALIDGTEQMAVS